ncbi:MAG: MoaD/ThiS family protein [Thermoplasmatota archaeon]
MRVRVRLLRPFSDAVGRSELELELREGAVVREVIERLSTEYPRFGREAYEADGRMSDYITMFLNDRPVTDLETALNDGDSLLVLFPVSGG